MDWTLEVVLVPVSDVDRAKAFYAEQLGFNVDHDTQVTEGKRIVQLTPPGSGCSIVVGEGTIVPDMQPGSLKGLQLVVPDIHAARDQLAQRGVEVGEIQVHGREPHPSARPTRQCRVRLLQRSGRQRVGGAADLRPRLAEARRRERRRRSLGRASITIARRSLF